MKRMLSIALGLVPALAFANTLFVNHPPNNGRSDAGAGVFMDLTDLTGLGLLVNGIDTISSAPAGNSLEILIYTRPGTYVGFDGDAGAWTLHGTFSATSAGNMDLFPTDLSANMISIDPNASVGVYFVVNTAGGIRYNGTTGEPPQTTWENGEIRLFSDVARGGPPFTGPRFTPRAFVGNIHYDVIPEPATLTAFGVGLAALLARRRRK